MQDHSRAQSALLARPSKTPTRASRFLSSFKGIIRIPVRKTKDDRDINQPYKQHQGGMKPYMSQPMLRLDVRGNYLNETQSNEGSSSSPEHSPSPNRNSNQIPNTPTTRPTRSRKFSANSLAGGLLPAAQAGLSFARRGISIDGLPPTHTNQGLPEERSGSRARKSSELHHKPKQSSLRQTIATEGNGKEPTITSTQLLKAKQQSSAVAHPGSMPSVPPLPKLTATTPTPIASHPTLVTGTSSADMPTNSGVLASTTPVASASTNTMRRPHMQGPRLTLPPPNHRFSLNVAGGSARLSPSIILRPPPLPLQLPKLPTLIPNTPATTSRTDSAGLNSMPALPLQGTSKGVHGHEEPDDGEEEEDDDEDHTEEEDRSSRPSMDSEANGSTRSPSPSSSYHSAEDHPDNRAALNIPAFAQKRFSGLLPRVDTYNLDLSFLDTPPTSAVKGKGKAIDNSQFDPSQTPTLISKPSVNTRIPQADNDYFNSRTPDSQQPNDKTPHPGHSYASPLRTPRAADSFSFPLPMHTPQLLSQNPNMYKRASRSLIDLQSMGGHGWLDKIKEQDLKEVLTQKSTISRKTKEAVVDSAESASSPKIPHPEEAEEDGVEQQLKRQSKVPAYESLNPRQSLRRRRSLPTYNASTEPPPYPEFPRHRFIDNILILPREDEGNEQLPAYKNDLYIKAIMPRKMEFTAKGVQAKDRKWRRVMVVLEGTALRIYQVPPAAVSVSMIGGWWEKTVGVKDVSDPSSAAQLNKTTTDSIEDAVREVERACKAEEGSVSEAGNRSVGIRLPPSSSAPPPSSFTPPQSSSGSGITSHPNRSALNLAVNFLKPSRGHTRANSDVAMSPTTPHSPRASLNLPRASGNGSHTPSSRSASPAPPSAMSNSTSSAGRSHSASLSVPSSGASLRVPLRSSSSNSSHTPSSMNSKGEELPSPSPQHLIRQYTLQNAESGLGNDYVKRKNVIRLRLEGEQFLLQAHDVAEVVEWIEMLQAATNVALDLDERQMPRGPLYPRRRRRRRGVTAATSAGNARDDSPTTASVRV